MSAATVPAWAAIVTATLVLLGSGLALTGTIGLLRLKTFYERTHAPTLGTTWGVGCILIGSMIYFSVLQSRPILHELLIAVFMTITTPITLVLLVRAALYRDRYAGNDRVPTTNPPKAGLIGESNAEEEEPSP
jgi:multicomponent K+:H+ antiporter subunit G